MASLIVDVVSAEEAIFAGEAKFVSLPGESGELGILPGHTPLISRIRPGTLKIVRPDNSEEVVFVAGGILEVQPGTVTVLADTAIRAADLDEAKAEAARQRQRLQYRLAQRNSIENEQGVRPQASGLRPQPQPQPPPQPQPQLQPHPQLQLQL